MVKPTPFWQLPFSGLPNSLNFVLSNLSIYSQEWEPFELTLRNEYPATLRARANRAS